jgi:predicted Zn-dependent peptidase
MKRLIKQIGLTVMMLAFVSMLAQPAMATNAPKKYTYTTVPNDPLKARIYKLDNGLTVYLTVYKNAPRVQTYIAVRAGSKNDPKDATGLAHYLEHMLFKGTDKFGSKDFAKEKPELDKIEALYETYRKTTDVTKRKAIYHQIDSVSGAAAKFAIANEYDKMLGSIGAKGTNAYTSVEQTVYVNDIPANQLEKWLTIEGERYRNPVLRLFHTELEAVYEEKNRGLDNDGNKMFEALFAGLFRNNTYGTQTTIGTIDHLKNPSITKIKKYYQDYYVPNNMAICLSGDLDPDATIKMIDAKFGKLPVKPVPAYIPGKEEPITKPIVKEVYGPDAETMMMGYRFGGAGTNDADMVNIIDKILYNGNAGLIDLNLNQSQKVLSANSGVEVMKDYTAHIIAADAREGQSLEEVKNLLLTQIELVKKGEFPEWLLSAIITDMKLKQTKAYESNAARADAFVTAFIMGESWDKYVGTINRLSKITKQQVMDFAKKNYTDNYVVVYKHTGEDKNVQKVDKPIITPVEVNRDSQSPFVKELLATKEQELQPVILNYKQDIKTAKIDNKVTINYKKNTENNTFDLYYIVEMGNNNDKKIGTAIDYLQYLGTSKYTPAALQQEFYKLGCSFGVNNSDEQVYVSLSGLTENFDKAVALFESLLADAQPNKEALNNLVGDILKKRADAKLSKSTILFKAMNAYGQYGANSPFTHVLTEAELKALKPEELIAKIKELTSFEHHILYYGPSSLETVTASLDKLHKIPATLKPVPASDKFVEQPVEENTVYVVNYDMKQAEIIMMSKGEQYNKDNAAAGALFNEYFGGGMSSVVFQDMRESKALAYSVFSTYRTPNNKSRAHYAFSYIGTQADKLPEAMKGMTALLNDMPESEVLFNAAKDAVIQKIRTERITKSDILFNYERAQKMGLDYDIRKDVFEKVPAMTMNDVKVFHDKYMKNKKSIYLILGDKNKLDMETLSKYGKVKFLSLDEIFGYKSID